MCVAGPVLVDADVAFKAAVVASQRFLHGCRRQPESEGTRPEVRFFRGGAMVMTDLNEWLPDGDDASAQSYAARIEERLRDESFELVINNLQSSSAALWLQLRELALPLYAEAGWPAGGADAALFLRNGPATSFGVHKDHASVFAFILAGRKAMLTWDDEQYRGEPFSQHFGPFEDTTKRLVGRPGDVLYWPSTHWHVGEAEPGLSMSVNLGFRYRAPSGTLEAKWIARQIESCHSLEDARRLLSSGDLDYEAQIWRLNQLTGYGFRPPEPRSQPLPSGARVRGSDQHLVLSLDAPGRLSVVSANGRAFALEADPLIKPLVEKLNTGSWFRATDLVARSSTSSGRMEELLRKLYGCWAIDAEVPQVVVTTGERHGFD